MNGLGAVAARLVFIRRRFGRWLSGMLAALVGRSLWLWLAFGLANDASATLEPGVGLATFDEVWGQVRDSHYDYERVRAPWEAAREELRALAGSAETADALREVISALLAVLGDSHYALLPASVMRDGLEFSDGIRVRGETGLTVALAEGRILVTGVEPGSVAEAAGILPGMSLLEIDGRALDRRLDAIASLAPGRPHRWAATFLELALQDRIAQPDSTQPLELAFEVADGAVRRFELRPEESSQTTFTAGNLPPMRFEFSAKTIIGESGACVGLVRFSAWVPALGQALGAAMPGFAECRGLIIDLRGNPGGVMAMMMPVAGWVFDEVTTLGTMRNPAGEMHFRAQPARVALDGTPVQPFTGPVAILVNRASVSTSEMFTAGLQTNGRARVFGSPTPGMALPASARRLASGDTLLYATADYIGPHGTRVEGAGVRPDEIIELTRRNLAECGDPVLLAALAWIEGRIGSESCNFNEDEQHDYQ